MKIAQVAPLYESVPPKTYGGTERVVSYLTEELVAAGQDVTLFASGDSETSAKLIPGSINSLRLSGNCVDHIAHHITMLDEVMHMAPEFDVIHFHIDYLHFPLSRYCALPSVTTLHGRLDLPDLIPVYRHFSDAPVVSISLSQRKPVPRANWVGNVYHGLPEDLHAFYPKSGDYLAFLGRISPEKRVDRAIEIAARAGMRLKIAAKIDDADRDYYAEKIKPLMNDPNVEYIGEIGEHEKAEFLGNAYAYLFPIDWPEPFGLTMIEAMACGTPTIAFDRGSVPEVMQDGVTGFIVKDMDQAVAAVEKISSVERAACRHVFEKRFTSSHMAEAYLDIYQSMRELPASSSSHSQAIA
ncbi:MAG: glycosyltransferase family 4 protein [Acidobacteriota bacterium]|nr:glycosyltransferase family 4 protein [Acidobacteriota bacterium]